MATYTTIQGDTWDLIAHTQLGGDRFVDRLMSANTEYLCYYTFPAGVVLTLPEIDTSDAASTLPPWKEAAG